MARFPSAFWLNVLLAVCVAGQSTVTLPPESIIPDPTGAPLPLTQYTFQYPDLPIQVKCVSESLYLPSHRALMSFSVHSPLAVVLSLATMFVIVQRKGRTPNVRPCSSTPSKVHILSLDIVYNVTRRIDFCLWGSPTANGLIGNVEAAVVA